MSIRSIATLVAVIGSLAAPAAFAKHDHTPTGQAPQGMSLASQESTREQVIQQVLAAQRDGTLSKMRSEAGYTPELQRTSRSGLSRDQVTSAVLSARRDGTLSMYRGEAMYAPEFNRPTPGTASRTEVKQEVLHARHDGVLDMLRADTANPVRAFSSMTSR